MTRPATVQLDLRPEPGWGGDPDRRLAGALKSLLRAWGWRCVAVRDLPAPAAPAARQGNADGAGGVGAGK